MKKLYIYFFFLIFMSVSIILPFIHNIESNITKKKKSILKVDSRNSITYYLKSLLRK